MTEERRWLVSELDQHAGRGPQPAARRLPGGTAWRVAAGTA